MRLIVVFSLMFFNLSAEVERISRVTMNRSKVLKVFVFPSMQTTLRVHCPIIHFTSGRNEEILIQKSETSRKELFIQTNIKHPTNLTIKCRPFKYFVFDIIPNKRVHQDVVHVVDSYLDERLSPLKRSSERPVYSKIIDPLKIKEKPQVIRKPIKYARIISTRRESEDEK